MVNEQVVGRDRLIGDVISDLREGRSVILEGAPGVGRTTVARAIGRRASQAGWTVEPVHADGDTAEVPFGAVTHLVGDLDAQHHQLLQAAVHRASTTEEANVLLVVDDADLLDAASASVIGTMLRRSRAVGLLTVRAGANLPSTLEQLWRSGVCLHRTIAPLRRPDARALLCAVLGGDVGARLEPEIWELARGHPLYIREVAQAARASGAITQDHTGTWHLETSLTASERLEVLVRTELERLAPSSVEGLELVALAGPLPFDVLRKVITSETLEELEEQRLVAVDDHGRVVVTHPLREAVLRASTPRARRTRHAATLAEVFSGDDHELVEPLQIAHVLVEAGADVPDALGRTAANEALANGDPALAERVLRAVRGPTDRALLLLGRALVRQQEGERAEAALARASEEAASMETDAEIAVDRARNLRWNLGELDAARDVLERAIIRTADSGWTGALQAELAMEQAAGGDLSVAAEAAAQATAQPGLEPRAELGALVVLTLTRGQSLELDGFDRLVERGLELAQRHRADEPLAEQQLEINQLMVSMYDDPVEAAARADAWIHTPTPLLGAWLATLGITEMVRGDVTAARRHLHEAVRVLEELDPFDNLSMVLAMAAVAAGVADDAPALRELRARSGPASETDVRSRVWQGRAAAWEAALEGDLAGAAGMAAEAGVRAIEGAHVVWGLDALHDAARFGHPDRVRSELVERDLTSVRVFAAHARHAEALATADADALEQVGRSYVAAGATLFGAEAFGHAAERHSEKERSVPAARAATVGAVLTDACPDAATPPLRVLPALAASERERQVVRLLAAGHRNREIANQLGLSVRTIENHLHRVYRHLAVSGREELRDLIPSP